jgi:hypothetical protein
MDYTAQKLADKLNNASHNDMDDILDEAIKIGSINKNKIVIAYSYQEDRDIEFYGVWDTTIGIYESREIWIDCHGVVLNECECQNCPYYEQELHQAKHYVDVTVAGDNQPLKIEASVPNYKFSIVNDKGEPFANGIVFSACDVV